MTDTPYPDHTGTKHPRFKLKLADTPGIRPDDAMSEAGRKILFHQFEQVLKHEPAARTGENIEAIHDMRVATRRMRSAIRLFEPYYKKNSPIRNFGRSLKTLATALGTVRDLDVFHEKLDKYLKNASAEDSDALGDFRKHIEAPEAQARTALVELLDSEKYREFITRFYDFLSTPGDGSPDRGESTEPHLVRHVLPPLVYTQYSAMRAYETVLNVASLDMLHQLRIEGKRLRYTLEFFTEVLGSEAKTAINAVKALQDHLGDLQDARVAAEMLQDYLSHANERDDMRPILRYLTTRENEKQRLLNTISEAWAAFTDVKMRRALALALVAL